MRGKKTPLIRQRQAGNSIPQFTLPLDIFNPANYEDKTLNDWLTCDNQQASLEEAGYTDWREITGDSSILNEAIAQTPLVIKQHFDEDLIESCSESHPLVLASFKGPAHLVLFSKQCTNVMLGRADFKELEQDRIFKNPKEQRFAALTYFLTVSKLLFWSQNFTPQKNSLKFELMTKRFHNSKDHQLLHTWLFEARQCGFQIHLDGQLEEENLMSF